MDRKSLAKRLIYLIFFIFLVNFLANKLYWYSSIWYFDMLMHTLGGFWVGLLYLYVFKPQKVSFRIVFKVILFILAIGIGWEVFEIMVNDVIARNPFNLLDTVSDIFFDLTGGISTVVYFYKKIMFAEGSGVQLEQ